LLSGTTARNRAPGIFGLTREVALRRGAKRFAAAFGRWAHEAPQCAQMERAGLVPMVPSCDSAVVFAFRHHGAQPRARAFGPHLVVPACA